MTKWIPLQGTKSIVLQAGSSRVQSIRLRPGFEIQTCIFAGKRASKPRKFNTNGPNCHYRKVDITERHDAA